MSFLTESQYKPCKIICYGPYKYGYTNPKRTFGFFVITLCRTTAYGNQKYLCSEDIPPYFVCSFIKIKMTICIAQSKMILNASCPIYVSKVNSSFAINRTDSCSFTKLPCNAARITAREHRFRQRSPLRNKRTDAFRNGRRRCPILLTGAPADVEECLSLVYEKCISKSSGCNFERCKYG